MTIRERVIALRVKQCARLGYLPDTTYHQRDIRQEIADNIVELDVILNGKDE